MKKTLILMGVLFALNLAPYLVSACTVQAFCGGGGSVSCSGNECCSDGSTVTCDGCTSRCAPQL